VRVRPWIAQGQVLSEAAVVVSHGGYGTTLGDVLDALLALRA